MECIGIGCRGINLCLMVWKGTIKMTCPKCGSSINNDATFCPLCGEKIAIQSTENPTKHCRVCGQITEEGNKFCGKCGTAVEAIVQHEVANTANEEHASSGKIKGSYFTSVISAIISFVIRIATQQTYYSWENLLDNRKVVGIDSDIKPFLTAIPVIATIIVSLLIVSDKNTSSQKKKTAFIVNAIFIALAILFIWFDIPYAILDF